MKQVAKTFGLGAVFVAGIGAAQFAHAQEALVQSNPRVTNKTLTQSPNQVTNVDVKLKGYVFGIRVMKATVNAQMTDQRYSVFSDLRTSGLGAFLKKFKIWSLTRGQFEAGRMRPKSHLHQNLDKKRRRVQMHYGTDTVDISIVPRLGSQGKPPATLKQRFESFDTLSAVLNIMLRGQKTGREVCTGKVPVFDSKQHYNLRMERAGTKRVKQNGFKGDTVLCNIYYEPVSGFDPEDLPSTEEVAAPVRVYLAPYPQYGLYVPVLAKYKISGFTAVIKARKINISTGPANQYVEFGDDFAPQEAKLRALDILNTAKYDKDD